MLVVWILPARRTRLSSCACTLKKVFEDGWSSDQDYDPYRPDAPFCTTGRKGNSRRHLSRVLEWNARVAWGIQVFLTCRRLIPLMDSGLQERSPFQLRVFPCPRLCWRWLSWAGDWSDSPAGADESRCRRKCTFFNVLSAERISSRQFPIITNTNGGAEMQIHGTSDRNPRVRILRTEPRSPH